MKTKRSIIRISLVLACAVMFAAFGAASPCMHANAADRPPHACFGDANHDKKINMEDAVALQKNLAEIHDCAVCRSCGDITGDGIDLTDVIEIQRHVAKIRDFNKCGTESGVHAFLEPRTVDSDTVDRIETAYLKFNPKSDSETEDILKYSDRLLDTKYYDTLSNGFMIVRCDYWGAEAPAIECKKVIGNYTYYYSSPLQEKYLLIGDRYVSIEDAYKKKLLSDKIFEELAFKLHMMWRNTFTLDNEFEDNTVLVCLTDSASKRLAMYSPSDFGIDGIVSVKDLTEDTRVKLLKQRMEPDSVPENERLDEDKYTQILLLTLSQHSKQNVLDTIEKLLELSIVESAEPNLYHKPA